MAKKVVKKKVIKKSAVSKDTKKILVENFVSLQKVMTHLSERFDELSEQISRLLELFELSAGALAKKEINFTKPMDEAKIMDKLESILDQNKTIARGLTLMYEKKPEAPMPKPLPTTPMRAPAPTKEKYQKSPFSKGF